MDSIPAVAPAQVHGRARDLTAIGLGKSVRVLCADFAWRPVGDLQVGDEIVAFDDYPSPGCRRRMRIATVTSSIRIRRPSYRLTLADGREIVTAQEHSWLSGWSDAAWIRARYLQEGREIRDLGMPWAPDNSWESGWLGGVFDGEAHLATRASGDRVHGDGWQINFSQNPGAVFTLAGHLLDTLGFEVQYKDQPDRKVERLLVIGMYDCFRFLGQCRPVRLLGKAHAWVDGTACTRSRGNHGNPYGVAIERLEYLGVRQVVAIKTTTNTLFAEGIFSAAGVRHKVRDKRGGVPLGESRRDPESSTGSAGCGPANISAARRVSLDRTAS